MFKKIIGDLLARKKFRAVIIGLIVTTLVALLRKFGVDIDPDLHSTLTVLVGGLFGAFVVGQGLADFGKEAKAENGKKEEEEKKEEPNVAG